MNLPFFHAGLDWQEKKILCALSLFFFTMLIHPDRARLQETNTRFQRNNKRKFNDKDAATAEEPKKPKIDLPDNLKAYIVFVTGIKATVTETALRTHFGGCGNIQRVKLTPRYAHIEFDNKSAVEAALKMDGIPLVEGEHKLKVKLAKESVANAQSSVVFFTGFDTMLDVADIEKAVHKKFSKYGTIVGDIRIPLSHNKKSLKQPKGVGYVKMSSVDEAKKVIKKLSGKEVAGGTLRLDYSDDMSTKPKKEKKKKNDKKTPTSTDSNNVEDTSSS